MHINLHPFPVLATKRLVLRALNIDDRDALLALRSDERVNKYIGRSSNINAGDVETFINKIAAIIENKQGVYWVICLKDNPKLIGTICYWNLELERDLAEIGYELSPDYQGQGLMQEAITVVINYGFNVMSLKVITALPHPDNVNSVKLLERKGFELDTGYQYVSKEDAGAQAVYVLVK